MICFLRKNKERLYQYTRLVFVNSVLAATKTSPNCSFFPSISFQYPLTTFESFPIHSLHKPSLIMDKHKGFWVVFNEGLVWKHSCGSIRMKVCPPGGTDKSTEEPTPMADNGPFWTSYALCEPTNLRRYHDVRLSSALVSWSNFGWCTCRVWRKKHIKPKSNKKTVSSTSLMICQTSFTFERSEIIPPRLVASCNGGSMSGSSVGQWGEPNHTWNCMHHLMIYTWLYMYDHVWLSWNIMKIKLVLQCGRTQIICNMFIETKRERERGREI